MTAGIASASIAARIVEAPEHGALSLGAARHVVGCGGGLTHEPDRELSEQRVEDFVHDERANFF